MYSSKNIDNTIIILIFKICLYSAKNIDNTIIILYLKICLFSSKNIDKTIGDWSGVTVTYSREPTPKVKYFKLIKIPKTTNFYF